MANIPTNVGYGTVTGQFILAYGDSSDGGAEPDAIPAKGSVIFTPSVSRLRDTADVVTILPAIVQCQLDANGFILGYTGSPGVSLVATNDTDMTPVDWTWQVEFRLTDADGNPVRGLNPFSFALPQGTTVDITTVTPLEPSNGTYYLQGPAGPAGPTGATGATGATGPANTLTVGTVTGGVTADATITGTAPNQTLNLVLPKGDTGDTGPTGPAGADGAGVEPGGTTNQLLAKASNADYDTQWVDAPNAANGIPTGGAQYTMLVKNSATDYDTTWTNTIEGGNA